MFTPEHAIWRFAYAADELDDWLPYAESLIQKWSIQDKSEVEIQAGFELVIAAFLAQDNLLPASASKAFATAVLSQIAEADANAAIVKRLLDPKKPGRKKTSKQETFRRMWAVSNLIREGMTASAAYEEVAEKHCKSPDTIRREYERALKKRSKRTAAGEKLQ